MFFFSSTHSFTRWKCFSFFLFFFEARVSCRHIFRLIREKKKKERIWLRIRENTQFTGWSKSWDWRCTSRGSYQKRIITRVTCSWRAVNFWLFLQMSLYRNRRMLIIAWYTAIKRNERSRWPTTVVRVYFICPGEIRRDIKLSNNDIQDDRDLSNQNDERGNNRIANKKKGQVDWRENFGWK